MQQAAANWLARAQHTPLGTRLGHTIADSYAVNDNLGRTICHVVRLEGGGFVVVSADTMVHPIIAFSSAADLIQDLDHPLYYILQRDLPQRMPKRQGLALTPSPPEAAWERLLMAQPLGLAEISDLRVAPLIETAWDQGPVYYVNDPPLYNYYTPENAVCGCTATAGAQLMYFHQWPQEPVTVASYACTYNGTPTTLTMQGGTYDWGNMPLKPREIRSSITETQRQAIGKLTSDISIAIRTMYGPFPYAGSGAYATLLKKRLLDRFGYQSAEVLTDTNYTRVMNALEGALLTNLDAGYPVGISIDNANGYGHFVIGDGYGFDDNTLYVHLNMGWSGTDNAWYNLPEIDDSKYHFTIVDGWFYNILPQQAGVFVTGRLLNLYDQPVAGATVKIAKKGTGQPPLASVTTDARGIYAALLPIPTSQQNITITATQGLLVATLDTTYAENVSTTILDNGAFYLNTGSVGNRWGANLKFNSAQPELSITGVQPLAPGTLKLSWQLIGGSGSLTGFDILGRSDLSSSTTWQPISSAPANTTSLNITPGTHRYFRVKAR